MLYRTTHNVSVQIEAWIASKKFRQLSLSIILTSPSEKCQITMASCVLKRVHSRWCHFIFHAEDSLIFWEIIHSPSECDQFQFNIEKISTKVKSTNQISSILIPQNPLIACSIRLENAPYLSSFAERREFVIRPFIKYEPTTMPVFRPKTGFNLSFPDDKTHRRCFP